MRSGAPLIIAGVLFVLTVTPCEAGLQKFDEAISAAYERSPSLKSARARLRVAEEGVSVAQSGWKPSIEGQAQIGKMHQTTRNMGSEDLTPRDMGITVAQPVFSGFKTVANVDAAKALVKAEQARVVNSEQELFYDAAKSFLDVVREQAVLRLTKSNEDVLRQQLDSTRQRLSLGEVTKTDVSQSEARLNVATALRLQAEGELQNAHATFFRLVGQEPDVLEQPVLQLDVPATLDEALELAKDANPLILQTLYAHDAAKSDVTAQQGNLLPEVSLVGSVSRAWDQNMQLTNRQDTSALMARMTIPLYKAGADYAKTRAAREVVVQRREDLEDARLRIKEGVVHAWQRLLTARAAIKAHEASVSATDLALKGVKEEAKVGTRTILDILNAEQECLNAQVNLVKVRHDEALALLQLKAALGQLTAEHLKVTPKVAQERL